jgi:hypothetical protein
MHLKWYVFDGIMTHGQASNAIKTHTFQNDEVQISKHLLIKHMATHTLTINKIWSDKYCRVTVNFNTQSYFHEKAPSFSIAAVF